MATCQSTISRGGGGEIGNFYVVLQIKPQLVWLPDKCLIVITT